MPDQAQGTPGTDSLYSPGEFATVLRQMHPELASEKDDNALTRAVLQVYPQFKQHVSDPDFKPQGPQERPRGPAELQPGAPPVISGESHIGADPGGHPLLPLPGEYGFEAGIERFKKGVQTLWRRATGQVVEAKPGLGGAFDGITRATVDVVGGGMKAAEPALLAAAATAPLPTAAAVVTGTIAQNVTEKAAQWAGAPPPVRELAGDVAAIVAGGKTAHAIEGPPSSISAPRSVPAEARFQESVYDVARRQAESMGDQSQLARTEDVMRQNRAAAEEADQQARARRDSTIALKAAAEMDKRGRAGASPFAYLDTVAYHAEQLAKAGEVVPGVTGPPLQLNPDVIESFRTAAPTEPGPPRLQLPEQAGPTGRATRPTFIGAEPGAPIEAVGTRAPQIAQATPEGAFESQQLSDAIDRAQTDHDRQVLQAQQDRYKQAHYEAAQDNAGELEQHTYDQFGRTIETAQGTTISRAVRGTSVYARIVEPVIGKAASKAGDGPPRELIAQIARAYADTGAKSSAELPADYLPSNVDPSKLPDDAKRFFSTRGFKNQYDRYIRHVIGVAEDRAGSRVATPGEPPPNLDGVLAHVLPEENVAWQPPPEEMPGGLPSAPVAGPPPATSPLSVSPAAAPEYTAGVLRDAGSGEPGLTSETRPASPPFKRPDHYVTYRNANGEPVATARVIQDADGKWYVEDFAADKTRGLLYGRAVRAIGDELLRRGITEPVDTVTPDAANLLQRAQEGGLLGSPPPLIEGEMPADWLGLPPPEAAPEAAAGAGERRAQPRAGAYFLGYQEAGPGEQMLPLYNVVGGPSDASTATAAGLRQMGIEVPDTPSVEDYTADPHRYRPTREQVLALKAELAKASTESEPGAPPAAPPAGPVQPSMFERLKGEEGRLVLDVQPPNRRMSMTTEMQDWLERNRLEYGDTDWFKNAEAQIDQGNPDEAWTIANKAAARSFDVVATGMAAARAKDFETATGQRTPTAREALTIRQRLESESGQLVLDVRPNDRAGLKQWYKDNEAEYGDRDWYQAGISALEAGDPNTAWRVAAIAAARSIGTGAVTTLPKIVTDQIKSQVADVLGKDLPKGATVGEGGVVKLPGNPGGLDPKYTDLVLGKNFVGDLVDLVDPATIVRVETSEGKLPSDVPKELRISYQMADQILRQMPDDLLQPFLDDTGLDRAQAAGHLARAASQAGKVLNSFKQWQDAHWDEILHLNPELGGTRGPGAAGRLEFTPEERQAQVLKYLNELKAKGQASPDMKAALKDMGFKLPADIKPETKEALTYTRRWLTKQRRLAEMAKTLDIAAQSGADFDKVAAATALGLDTNRSALGQMFDDVFGRARLAFMLSQTATTAKILESHGLRYNVGMLEEVLSGVASRAMGNHEAAAQHFSLAKEMGTLKHGTFPTGLLKKPWTDNLGEMFNYTAESVTGLAENDRRRALSTLSEFPREEARMTGAALLGEESPASKVPGVKWLVDPRVRNLLTIGLRTQSAAIRSSLYDATLRSAIAAEGDSPADILGSPNPGQALIDKYGETKAEQMIGAGVSSALNYTYAGAPLPDSLPGAFVKHVMTDIPVVSTMLRFEWAFPRFQFATVPRWIWDRMPGSMMFDMMLKPLGKGRLARGAERTALETVMPTAMRELNVARYDSAKALQGTMEARLDAAQAAKALKALQKRGEGQETLPDDVSQQMTQTAAMLQEKVQAATELAQQHRAAEGRVSDLLSQVRQSGSRLRQLQEIDAPSFEQYLARQAVGTGVLMPLALAVRNSKGAEDTNYYQYRVGGKLLDIRPFLVGFAPFLLYADFFSDVAKNTEWAEVARAHQDGDDWSTAFSKGYNGKYTGRALLADTFEAWLTIHPLFGTASFITDALAGRQQEGEGSVFSELLDHFLATTGQAIGSFTMPAQTVTDLAASVVPSEALTRTPERPGQYTGAAAELTEPAISHVPGVREAIPERVDPFTGAPRELEHPALHQLLGTSFGRDSTDVEKEVLRTGLKPGMALPRVSGDAQFDNRVNQAYSQILHDHFSDVLRSPEYQKLPNAHRRDILEQVFKGLKAAAYAKVASQLTEELGDSTKGGMATIQHLQPEKAAKIERWKNLLQNWAKQDAPPVQPPPGQEAQPEENFGAAPPSPSF